MAGYKMIGEILRGWDLVDGDAVKEALKMARGSGLRIGEALIEMGRIEHVHLARALAAQNSLKFVDLNKHGELITPDILEKFPEDLIQKHRVLPIGEKNGRIRVLTHDPMNLAVVDDLRFRLGSVELMVAAEDQMGKMIDKVLNNVDAQLSEFAEDMGGDGEMDELEEGKKKDGGEEEDDDAPIVRLVNQILSEAVAMGTSDIHFEPMADRMRLRYRVDGVCQERDTIPKRTQNSVIARLKIISKVRVEERRIPQDGRIKARFGGKKVDFRVSFCPAYHGESVVLRILRPDAASLGLEKLGMRDDTMQTFEDVIKRPNGIFLVTGPTGSGKTTTLYSALQSLNRPDRKIITAEDPIEYNFKGINQCQVNEQTGLTFKLILRAMLRQAPNIILVGEIRDKEVGEVAIQAALTGHMVFSTLHTNDAPSAMTRLIDMGLKPFLVASSVQAVLAQRLIRLLHPDCKQPDPKPDKRDLALCGIKSADLEGRTLYRAGGCRVCSNKGFKGRQGVYELMMMNTELREMTFKRAPVSQLQKAAANSGMRNLLGDGRFKVLDGKTTAGEVARIAQVEGTV